jgi:phage gp36-like protein
MAYCTPAAFLQCYDSRRVGQLLTDNDEPLFSSQILSSSVLAELLRQATKIIDAACAVGDRYDPTELATLASDVEHGGLIRRLCADIAFGLLQQRRGYSLKEIQDLSSGYQLAMDMLEQLRMGERIFNLDGVPEAGLPDVVRLGVNSAGPSVANCSRFFGNTPTTNRFGYGGLGGGCGCG